MREIKLVSPNNKYSIYIDDEFLLMMKQFMGTEFNINKSINGATISVPINILPPVELLSLDIHVGDILFYPGGETIILVLNNEEITEEVYKIGCFEYDSQFNDIIKRYI
jgi:hypothetical protein